MGRGIVMSAILLSITRRLRVGALVRMRVGVRVVMLKIGYCSV